ncbi:MAG: 2-keto-4-pentenoate hydratase [Gammaproteobacteria bacterium]
MTTSRFDASAAGEWAAALFEAWRRGTPRPVRADAFAGLAIQDAYRVQREYVRLRVSHGDGIAGFKAAMTAPDAAGRLNPIGGVLFSSGTLRSGATFAASALVRGMLETEVGFVAGATVRAPLAGDADPLAVTAAIVPMFELADAGFAGPARMGVHDAVAASAVASHQLPGEPVGTAVDPDAVSVVLSRDGEFLHRGHAREAMGGQRNALRWLIDHTIAQGYVIEPGHLLMTGSLGSVQPLRAGRFQADFGPLGSIECNVT